VRLICAWSRSSFNNLPESLEPAHMFNPIGSKATVCAFTYTPGLIVTGHESGKVALFDVKTGDEVLNNERAHMDVVTDLQLSQDRTYFVTSSKDKTARACFMFKITQTSILILSTDTRHQNPDGNQNIFHRDTTQQCCVDAQSTIRTFYCNDIFIWLTITVGSFGRRTGGYECYDDVCTTGQV
jgi:WD40 repeat protein